MQVKLVYAEHNTLYNEINWFYPKSWISDQIDRCVTYNYGENCWTTSSLARTSYVDAGVYDLPYATEYDSTSLPNFPIQGITKLMVHQLTMLMKPEPIKSIHLVQHQLMHLFNQVILIYLQDKVL